MSLLRGQSDVSTVVSMPTENMGQASTVNSVSGETVVWYKVSTGAWTAASGSAAGTIVTAKLTNNRILNSINSAIGSYNDTSLTFAAATRAAQTASAPEDLLAKMQFMSPTDQIAAITPFLQRGGSTSTGNYIIDHRRGQAWLDSKATVANDSATYKNFSASTSGTVTVDSEFPAAGALADATVNPTTTGSAAYNEFFNGTTWDRGRSGVVTPTTTLTGMQNNLSWAVYNAAPTSRTEGQGGPLQANTSGDLKMVEQFAAQYEDQTNNVAATQNKPLTTLTYNLSIDKSAALEASSVTKASAGNLYWVSGRIDSTAPTATYYYQILSAASLPADGAVTFLVAPIKLQHVTGTDTPIIIGEPNNAVTPIAGSATGLVECLSSTEFTKTISGAYLSTTIGFI